MSQPILTRNLKVIDAAPTGNISSSSLDISDCTLISVQAVWSGTTPSGTVSLEGSLDGVNFNSISASTISVTGASGSGIISAGPVAVPFIRATFTYTSGTVSSLKVYISCKQAA